jgi:hypothetical protein
MTILVRYYAEALHRFGEVKAFKRLQLRDVHGIIPLPHRYAGAKPGFTHVQIVAGGICLESDQP